MSHQGNLGSQGEGHLRGHGPGGGQSDQWHQGGAGIVDKGNQDGHGRDCGGGHQGEHGRDCGGQQQLGGHGQLGQGPQGGFGLGGSDRDRDHRGHGGGSC